MTTQSGAPAATQVSRLVDISGNPLGVTANPFIITPSGLINETLPATTLLNLVAPRTDTTTFTSADMIVPAFTSAIIACRVTAVSGTGPSLTLSIQTKDSQGTYGTVLGGQVLTVISTVTAVSGFFAPSFASTAMLIGATFRIIATIAGTTPSFTWYLDMEYK